MVLDSAADLRGEFNRFHHAVRLVALLSPT